VILSVSDSKVAIDGMWKEGDIASFEVLNQELRGGNVENHIRSQPRKAVLGLRLEPGFC
jgi:hypothetical protein